MSVEGSKPSKTGATPADDEVQVKHLKNEGQADKVYATDSNGTPVLVDSASVGQGGVHRKVAEKVLTTPSGDVVIPINPAVQFDGSVSEIVLIATIRMDDSDLFEITINNTPVTSNAYNTIGSLYSNLGARSAISRLNNDFWGTANQGNEPPDDRPIYIELRLGIGEDDFGGGTSGVMRLTDPNRNLSRYAQVGIEYTDSLTEINEFRFVVGGATFLIDSRWTVYTKRI